MGRRALNAVLSVSSQGSESNPAGRRGTELRPISAVFVDLVDSTGLAESIDVDDFSVVISACITRIASVVEARGGSVGAYTGDGLAAFFGLERAAGSDAEQSALAALEVLESVRRYSVDLERQGAMGVEVRIGINTGQAAVSALGPGTRPNVALGDTTNVAARLQAIAEPGSIVVGDETARALSGRFGLESLGDVPVRGRRAPVRAWRLSGTLDQAAPAPTQSLLDREPELESLGQRLDALQDGQGGVVFIVGDLGIGKTALLAEMQRLAQGRAAVLTGFCAASPAPIPYEPFGAMLRSWSPLGQPLGSGVGTLQAQLQALSNLAPSTIVRLVAIAERTKTEGAALTPRDAADAVREWLEAASAEHPLLLAIDDSHWLEPSAALITLEIAELSAAAPVLLATTLRPTTHSHGSGLRVAALAAHRERALDLRLRPLGEQASRALVNRLAPNAEDEVVADVLSRAEGNPLYLEQLIRARCATDAPPEAGGKLHTVATARLLPAGVASVLVGRFDALEQKVREVAQLAAAIGRTFDEDLLYDLVGNLAAKAGTTALAAAEIIEQAQAGPPAVWRFIHALLRDAALSTLPREERRKLFGRVARAYEGRTGGAEAEYEALAFYYARSEDEAKALHYHELAAEKALRMGAFPEASATLEDAVLIAERTHDEHATTRIRVQLAELRQARADTTVSTEIARGQPDLAEESNPGTTE
jgi:class 3 adenylate cyclase